MNPGRARLVAAAVWLALVAPTGAARAYGPGPDPGVEEALEEGDHLFFTGHRPRGARAWRRALRAGRRDRDLPVELRARVRLYVHRGTTWSRLAHAVAIQRKVARCDPLRPQCQLAFLEVERFGHPGWFAGGVASTRLDAVAAHRPSVVAALRGAPPRVSRDPVTAAPWEPPEGSALDGFGRARRDGLVAAPYRGDLLGGVVASPGLGVGASVRGWSRDAFGRRVVASGAGVVASRGGAGAVDAVARAGALRFEVGANAVRARWYDADAGSWAPVGWGGAGAMLGADLICGGRWATACSRGLGWRWDCRARPSARSLGLRVGVGPEARWDAPDAMVGALVPGHGAVGKVELWASGLGHALVLDLWGTGSVTPRLGLGSYERTGIVGGSVIELSLAPHAVRLIGRVEAARGPDQPFARVPMLGGAATMLSVPPGALRGPASAMGAAQADVVLHSRLWLRGGAELGAVPGAALAGGTLGLWWSGPPFDEPLGVTVGGSRLGAQVHVGWGGGALGR